MRIPMAVLAIGAVCYVAVVIAITVAVVL